MLYRRVSTIYLCRHITLRMYHLATIHTIRQTDRQTETETRKDDNSWS